jgi:hypothetical protein
LIVPGLGVERSMWQRQTQWQAGRLRIVDDDHVPAALELLRVHLVVALPGAPLVLREVLRIPLERVVHQLRRVEELLTAEDDLPVGVDPDVAHERHERVEDLRDAAAWSTFRSRSSSASARISSISGRPARCV